MRDFSRELKREIIMAKINKVLVVCAVGLLGILSLGTGFGAEVTKIKVKIKPISRSPF